MARFDLQSGDILILHIENDLIAVVFAANRYIDSVAARREIREAESAMLINRLWESIGEGAIISGFQRAPDHADLGNGLSRSFIYYSPARFVTAGNRRQFDVDVLDHP